MARAYSRIRPRRDFVYDSDEVLKLYDICGNTLTNWRKAGLRPVDDQIPALFTGQELARFHAARAQASRSTLRPSQFKCLRCKAAVVPGIETLALHLRRWGGAHAQARCPECLGSLSKLLDETDRDRLQRCLESNTSLHILDEEDSALRAGIGTEAGSGDVAPIPMGMRLRRAEGSAPGGDVATEEGAGGVSWIPSNERVLHDYLVYTRRYHRRTVEAIMGSIRDFEHFLAPKPFKGMTHQDVDGWRDRLLKQGDPDAPGARSRSTIRHRASHVRGFLKWLVQQPAYLRLNHGLAEYAVLPRAASAALLQPPPRPYPSPEEALAMLEAMPGGSMRERRDRAIVAFLLLTGLRADTAASIRLGDIDPKACRVRVDARHVRAKNGKSLIVDWFPVGEEFEAVVRAWIEELVQLGAQPGDALFPQDEALSGRSQLIRTDEAPLKPWASSAPIRRAFARGCRAAELRAYTPHSARHFLKALGDQLCQTEPQRDAWSRNLGHETRQIVNRHGSLTSFGSQP